MTAPLKMPPPPRVPRDLSRLVPELVGAEPDSVEAEADHGATRLWKRGDRSGVRWTSLETSPAERVTFQTAGDEDESTLIFRPNSKAPRLLRNRAPAMLAPLPVASAIPSQGAVPAPVLLEAAPSDVTPPAAVVVPAPPPIPRDVLADGSFALPMGWEETPPFVVAAPPRRLPLPARWVASVGLAAVAAVVLVVSDPERSASFVDQLAASGAALAAAFR